MPSYRSIRLRKGDGTVRLISAPSAALEAAQRAVLAILGPAAHLHSAAHGFVEGRSIVTNALPHVGRAVVVRLDIAGFFHAITINRVIGAIVSLGFSRKQAMAWSLVCTQSVPGKGRVLPQGACTSPILSNVVCIGLDCLIHRLCMAKGFAYTRYADDITFSGDDVQSWPALLGCIESAVAKHGFTVNRAKTKVMLSHCKQSTAGVVVNQRPNVDRKTRKRVRAALHQNPTGDPATLGMQAHIEHVRKGTR